jgi:hypothetical protein
VALATLRVDFEANVAKISRDVKKIETMLQRRTRSMQKIAKRAGSLMAIGLGAAFGSGLTNSIRRATDELSLLANQAEKLGITTDALQELRFVAGQAGVSVKSFDVGFQRFVRRAADAAQGNKALAKTFREFNIELYDANGLIKDGDKLFLEFADAIAASDDQGKRILKTFQLFDTEGVDLVRVLMQGSEAILRQREEARQLGVVIDSAMVEKTRAAGDRLKALSDIIRARVNPVLAEMAPRLVRIAERFVWFLDKANEAAKAVDGFATSIRDFLTWLNIADRESRIEFEIGLELPESLEETKSEIERVKGVVSTLEERIWRLKGKFGDAVYDRQSFITAERSLAKYEHRLRTLQDWAEKQGQKSEDKPPMFPPGGEPPELPTTGPVFKDISAELAYQNELLSARILLGEKDFEIAQKIFEAQKELGRTLSQAEEAELVSGLELQKQLEDMVALEQEAEQLKASLRTPWDEASDALERYDAMLERNLINMDEWAKATNRALDEAAQSFEKVEDEGKTTAETLKELFTEAGQEMAQSITDAVLSASLELETLQDLATSVFKQIAKSLIQQQIVTPLAATLPIPFLATGGPVLPGRQYIVGEAGPELLTLGRKSGRKKMNPDPDKYLVVGEAGPELLTMGRQSGYITPMKPWGRDADSDAESSNLMSSLQTPRAIAISSRITRNQDTDNESDALTNWLQTPWVGTPGTETGNRLQQTINNTNITTTTPIDRLRPPWDTPLSGRASGGPVLPGQRYLVGESGPELLTMGNKAGFITPSKAPERAAANNTVVNITNNTSGEASVRRSNGANGQQIVDIVIGAINENIARGGSVSQTLQNSFTGFSRRSIGRT